MTKKSLGIKKGHPKKVIKIKSPKQRHKKNVIKNKSSKKRHKKKKSQKVIQKNKIVHRVSFGPKKIDSFASITKHDLELPVTGAAEQFKIKLNDKNQTEKQSYVINGRLISKKARVNAGSRIHNEVNIAQANLGTVDAEKMTITNIFNLSGIVCIK